MASLTSKIESEAARTIKSFIFLDLETTDLIKGNNIPKITELAMVAVSRNDIEIFQNRRPRVQWKLVLPFNPLIKIPEIVVKHTGLSNDLLERVKPFDSDAFCSVMHFVQKLEEPVCFVAHNGRLFDYPVLLKAFRDHDQEMPDEVLSIDSIDAFRYFFNPKPPNKKQKMGEGIENGKLEKYDSLLKDSWDDAVCMALDSVESFPSFDEGIEMEKTESIDKNTELHGKLQMANEKTPELQIIRQESSKSSNSPKNSRTLDLKKPANYKLGVLYHHLTGSMPDNQHDAEDDCLTLIRCANFIGRDFVEFADRNAKPIQVHERRQN